MNTFFPYTKVFCACSGSLEFFREAVGEIEVEKAYMVATAHTSTYYMLCCTGTNFHKSLQTCPLWKAIAPLLRHDEQLLVLAGAESVCKVCRMRNENSFIFHGIWQVMKPRSNPLEFGLSVCSNINFVKLSMNII